MGKNLRTQRRGRGTSPTYRSPGHRHFGAVKHFKGVGEGIVEDIIQAPGRSAPVAIVRYDEKKTMLIAPDGLEVGQTVTTGKPVIERGCTLPLGEIPEGTLVYNIEMQPGDGGKLVRAAGATALIVSQGPRTILQLPSGRMKDFDRHCRATVGVVSGAGRGDKPFYKAGRKFFAYRSLAKAYFKVRGVAMNPVDHPHGGGAHQHVGKPSTVSSGAPPGRKVGRLSPQKKRKVK
jgi:large subunit ribosomal protein L2